MVVSWLLCFLQREEERLDGLVEFVRSLWINGFIIELELIVGEILHDWHFGFKVNWSSLYHEYSWIKIEAFSWSLLNWVLIGLRVVIGEVMLMLLDAVGDAEADLDNVTRSCLLPLSLDQVNGILVHSVLLHLQKRSKFDLFH